MVRAAERNDSELNISSTFPPRNKLRNNSICSDELFKVKPRSLSHRDYNRDSTQPVPIITKPRSNSFDAVGRANKYISGLDNRHYGHQIGYYSAPLSNKMIQRKLGSRLGSSSGDDGIGSSSGSAGSVELVPTKRKVSNHTKIKTSVW